MVVPNRIIVAGDWHGNSSWAYGVIRQVPKLLAREHHRLIVHCGDFGIWPGEQGRVFLDRLDYQLETVGATLWFIDGNHDCLSVKMPVHSSGGIGWARPRIGYLRRGHRWSWHGRTWLALGGAVSVDKALRTPGVNWWPTEEITAEQVKAVVRDGHADVMVCHDAPASVPLDLPPVPASYGWMAEDLDRSAAHRQLLQGVVDRVRPGHLFHGHYHPGHGTQDVPLDYGPLRVVRLDGDGYPGNWGVLDLATMAWSFEDE